jgi:hypothetical protein
MITPSFSLTATERVLPRLALDFTTATLDSRITFTRTGNTATVVNSSGYIAPINANLPRFDYDPTTLVCKGLLVEESRVNLCLQSGDQSVLPWAATRAGTATISTTQNYAIAPDNTQTATRVVMNLNGGGGSSANLCVLSQPILVTSGTTYTASFYAKTNDGTTKTILVRDDSAAATFNVLKTVTGSYQRITVSGTAASTIAANFKIWLRGTVGTSFDADLSVWGWQWEAGAFPTSYIPTVAATVTRNADVATMTGTNFSDWFNPTEGTFAITAIRDSSPAAGKFPYCLFLTSTSGNDINLYQNGATSEQGLIRVSGGSQANLNSTVVPANTKFTQSVGYKLNSFAQSVNAGALALDALGTVPTLTEMQIGSGGGGFQLNGRVQKVNYWPQRLTDNEIQAFSKN